MLENPIFVCYNVISSLEGSLGSLFDKLFKREIDQNSCHYCKTPFQSIQGGFHFGDAERDIGASNLRMRKGVILAECWGVSISPRMEPTSAACEDIASATSAVPIWIPNSCF